MKIGRSCPRYQDFGLIYPESMGLQRALCEYFVVIVDLCKQAVVFLKKLFWSQLSFSILKPFESEFGSFHQDLESLASAIRDEVFLASNQAQQNETTEMSRFRALSKKFSEISAGELEQTRELKRRKAEVLFLNACSVYNHENSWKQARKKGNTEWIFHDEGYKLWKQKKSSSTLWCTGILGSGKTVVSANVVEDLQITTPAVVSYFFCRYDEVESLQARTIIGSIARQIFDHIKPDAVDAIAQMRSSTIDIYQVLAFIQKLLPSDPQEYFIIIDGLDECEEKESKFLLQCLKRLLMTKHVFQVYCSSRPDVFRWASALLEPEWSISMSQTRPDIEAYIEGTLEQRLESGDLFIGDPTIILTIRDVLLENAHGMFLWVVFQIDSICSQNTDMAILKALEDLPKDLPETFNRILRKLQHSSASNPHFCQKIFDLVASVQRPLTLEELREAVSVERGNRTWDASKLVNNMLKSLLDSCGSLVAVDEEHLTVHFAHQSVKKHLFSGPMDSDIRTYHINSKEAALCLGNIIVTYLNLGIFDRQLTKANPTVLPQTVSYPSAILENLSRPNFASKLAVKVLKSRKDLTFDIHTPLKTAAGIVDGPKEQTQSAHAFLSYAQEYWLFHTKGFTRSRAAEYSLWQRLVDGKVNMVTLPWEWTMHHDKTAEMTGLMKWSTQNEHWALIALGLFKINESQGLHETAKPMLDFLESGAADMNVQKVYFVVLLHTASFLNNKEVVLLSLRKGADINSSSGYHTCYGSALEAASTGGHEEIVRLLLEKGANVNAEGGFYGSALQAASACGHDEIVRLLLENWANINAGGGTRGTALQDASIYNKKEIVRLLLENGANVNAEGGTYGTALQAASAFGHNQIVRLLLENGAHANAKGGCYGNALKAASANGHNEIMRLLVEYGANVNAQGRGNKTLLETATRRGAEAMVQLLLDNGAIIDDNTMKAAADSPKDGIKMLLRNARNSKSRLAQAQRPPLEQSSSHNPAGLR